MRRALVALPLVKLAIHLAAAGGYGYFRDELYYLACSRRLAWGYVDHPPFSIAVLRLWTAVAGESLLAIRFVPALVGALTVLVTGLTVSTLGGGAYAAVLAMLCVIVAPEYLALDGYYSMNAFDVLVWTLAGYVLVRILRGEEGSGWAVLGLVLGVGLLNKLSVLWLGMGLVAGLVLTRERRRLLTAGPWIAAALAAVLLAPHVLWQVRHAWPTAEFIRNATTEKMVAIQPLEFALAQVRDMHPLTAPVWLAGLVFAFAGERGRFRPLAIVYLAVFALLVVNEKSRAVYLAPAYPVLFACGAIAIAEVARGRRAWLRPVYLTLLVVGGIATAPLALAVLPPERFVAYAARLGVKPSTEEKKEIGELPQFFADRFGWPELVTKVEAVVVGLRPDERARAAILTGNYGEAGALEVLGEGHGLPPVVSGHNNYWLWGPGPNAGDPLIVVAPARARARLEQLGTRVEDEGTLDCRYCMPYERDSHIFVARGLPGTLAERWPGLKHYE